MGCFRAHEIWTLKQAIRLPVLSPILFLGLWVWAVPLVLILGSLSLLMIGSNAKLAMISFAPTLLIAVAAFVIVGPWFLGWVTTCGALMSGHPRRATQRLETLMERGPANV
ncbi:hypothetical protein Q5Y75_01970 [Ruegeria sp. 2205SS24-7]|uniref:hypothetical protein n=1 Tax=Ruegeria discodermiae TaxID=3064389 RepID=UPI00274092C1|nr:hypothetical protein [Ruegeria sp. 2205SS24-7]MDP5215976.1 hypothetical protein [Ruegeria sp. 2205SS24-7]